MVQLCFSVMMLMVVKCSEYSDNNNRSGIYRSNRYQDSSFLNDTSGLLLQNIPQNYVFMIVCASTPFFT